MLIHYGQAFLWPQPGQAILNPGLCEERADLVRDTISRENSYDSLRY